MGLALAGCSKAPLTTGGVVSTNPCADQLLLALAPPGRIAAISHYSQEAAESSVPLDVARRFRGVAGTAEEVIALKPDLVLASSFTPPDTLKAYDRLGLKVLLLDSPTSIAASRDQVTKVAAALGEPAAGAALNARIDAAVAAAAPRDAARPSAVLFISGNLANGGPTLLSEMLVRVGFADGAKPLGLTQSRTLPLERLLKHPPQLILEPNPAARLPTLRRHILSEAGFHVVEQPFPRALDNCGGPTIADAMPRLAEIRARVVR